MVTPKPPKLRLQSSWTAIVQLPLPHLAANQSPSGKSPTLQAAERRQKGLPRVHRSKRTPLRGNLTMAVTLGRVKVLVTKPQQHPKLHHQKLHLHLYLHQQKPRQTRQQTKRQTR